MGKIIDNGGSLKVRGVSANDDFSFTLMPRNVMVAAGSTTYSTVYDAYLENQTSATLDMTNDISASVPFGSALDPNGTVTLTNEAPGVCTFDANGASTYVANGTASVVVKAGALGMKRVTFPVTQAGGQTISMLDHYLSGSLGRYLTDLVSSLIAGKTPSADTLNTFSVIDNVNGIYTRNPDLWAAGIDLTAIPVINTQTYQQYDGIAVSPQHVLSCVHAEAGGVFANGTVFGFVANDNTLITRKVVGSMAVAPIVAGDYEDILITALDTPLPASIKFAKVGPPNLQRYLPSTITGTNTVIPPVDYPALSSMQDKTLVIHSLLGISQLYMGEYSVSGNANPPFNPAYVPWYQAVRSGDSGAAVFLPVNGNLLLLYTIFSGYGPDVSQYVSHINAAMATLLPSAGYSLSVMDLSGFTLF
jgi:hypothetical protein